MKKVILLVSCFCVLFSLTASDCNNDATSPSNPSNSIGVVSYTEDGGESWFTRNVALAGDVKAISTFPTDMDTFCIVVKYSTTHEILKTTSSGNSFYTVYSTTKYISDITGMETEGKGFVIGEQGFILMTTDYGSNWNEVTSGVTSQLISIDFGNEMNGIIIGSDIILTTSNGGLSWIAGTSPAHIDELQSVSYITSFPGNEAVACGTNGKIFRTTNNGDNWTQISSPINESFESLDFIDPVGIIGYGSASALRSTDRGLTWYEVITPSQGAFHKVYTESSFYWLISVVNLVRSSDQGQTWASRRPSGVSLNDGAFLKNKGIVVGNRIN